MSVHNFNSTEIRALLSSEFATDAKTYQSSGGNEPEGRSNRDREKDVIRMLTRGVAGLNKETPAKGG